MLVTGATGFVGSALVRSLNQNPRWIARAVVRRPTEIVGEQVTVSDLAGDIDWDVLLGDVQIVVHSAALVHQRHGSSVENYRKLNVDSTVRLARAAAAAGARRFVFLSSVKVNGESTPIDKPFRADDPANPREIYARSKSDAEVGLRNIADETSMEVVVVRPVLVYGPGVRANFLELMRWLDKEIPLPFALVANARSLVSIGNLQDFLLRCLDHPAASGQTFLVSDGEDLSTPELLQRTATAMGRRLRLFPIPVLALRAIASIVGKRDFANRLLDSLRVDISKSQRLLNWRPPIRVDAALQETAEYYYSAVAARQVRPATRIAK
ncbi:MAG: NAD-dependent epimerase/dehydratase family protein [Gemmatimonadaceae bacterium]